MSGFLDFLSDPNGLPGMLALNTIETGLQAGGRLTSAASHFQYGDLQRQAADFQAGQLRTQAGQAQAASQRSAFDVDQQSRYIASDAIAKAAASGGGVSDPTVVHIVSRIAAEGAYRRSLALYGGDERARLMNVQADAKQYEGQLAQRQSDQAGVSNLLQAGTTLLQGYEKDSSILKRFGGDGPKAASDLSDFYG